MSDPIVASDDLLCPQCGYNLRGIHSDRCPECGLEIDRELFRRSIIPWTFRSEIGTLSAFSKTITLAIRHPRRLANATALAVDYHDAQKFRWIVVLLAWLPLCAMMLFRRFMAGNLPFMIPPLMSWPYRPLTLLDDVIICFVNGVASWPVPSMALLLLMAGIGGVGSYFFHPKSLGVVAQNRAIALSYYAAAPLVFLFVPCLLLVADAVLVHFRANPNLIIRSALIASAAASLIAIVLRQWFVTVLFLKFTTHCTSLRLVSATVLLPILWLILMVLALGVFPLLCGFVKLLIVGAG